jgi:hypothetical protein
MSIVTPTDVGGVAGVVEGGSTGGGVGCGSGAMIGGDSTTGGAMVAVGANFGVHAPAASLSHTICPANGVSRAPAPIASETKKL